MNHLSRHHIAHTLRAALLLAAAALWQGCSTADEPRSATGALPGAMPGGATLHTGFSVTISDTGGNAAAASRAPGHLGDGYDTGAGYENYIDITGGNFRFYFFDSSNRLVAPMNVEAVLPTGETATSKTYYVSGETETDIRSTKVKVVALANWPEYPADSDLAPGTTTIADLCSARYAFDPARMVPSAENLIPLYGVSPLVTLDFDDANRAEIGTIHLLRAFAKVEVLRNPASSVEIEAASIVRYNNAGYCAPAGVNSQEDYVHGSYDKDYVASPHIPAGAETNASIPMARTADGSFIAYIPEYRNTEAGGSPRPRSGRALIAVRFKGVTAESDTVEFRDYSGAGGHFDILRNYWYRFTLAKNLEPMVQMVPYNEVSLEPDFGLVIGPNYVPVLDDNGKIVYWYDPDTGKYYGPDKKTEVPDPYISVDPVTGWSLVRDDNNRFFCYYVPTDDIYYATDKLTQIENPFQNVDPETGWNKIIDFASKTLYYYYDRKNSVWYNPSKEKLPENTIPSFPGTSRTSQPS
ncbi:MAG: FimB/Mfa2 family fimbrial subunit [Muribaculaceae bacterium]|nr:FimB/Mfa2 family fimbrial subunit [Muribaculaceae bacterium]